MQGVIHLKCLYGRQINQWQVFCLCLAGSHQGQLVIRVAVHGSVYVLVTMSVPKTATCMQLRIVVTYGEVIKKNTKIVPNTGL